MLSGALINLLAFIVAISVLVAVHEYGHYIVGRWCGMKVLRFSIGFGKPIWTRVAGKDQTEFCLSAIPIGGYVKFLGERYGTGEPVDPADEGRAFNHRPVWNRILVLLAGPFFNFLFAFLAYWVLFINGVPTMKPAVGDVAEDSYAAEAGLRYGDRIIKVGERDATDWETALVSMLDEMVSDGTVTLQLEEEDGFVRTTTINVGDDRTRLTEPGMLFDGIGFQPWRPPAVLATVEDGGAGAVGGLEVGDRITSIDGEPVRSFGDLQQVVSARPDETVTIELVRNDEPTAIDLTIGSRDIDGQPSGFLNVGIGNAAADYWYLRQFGPLQSIGQSIERTWTSTMFTVRMLGRMVTGEVSIKNISGPINIAQFAGSSATAGLNSFLNFLALVSISLGVLNLLPVPVLDGGQIVYHGIEGIKGSPLSERAQLIGQQVGILALLLLMSFAFYNDIARILS
ncbi:MAG: RIP metalloprotease RseP [Gammaproteobacteria bacterium]|nr:RIP metalloprotease RseP [Gammaproteobacteria bacterium]